MGVPRPWAAGRAAQRLLLHLLLLSAAASAQAAEAASMPSGPASGLQVLSAWQPANASGYNETEVRPAVLAPTSSPAPLDSEQGSSPEAELPGCRRGARAAAAYCCPSPRARAHHPVSVPLL